MSDLFDVLGGQAFYAVLRLKRYQIIFLDRKRNSIGVHEDAFLAVEVADKSITFCSIEVRHFSLANGNRLCPNP